ncbi:MAG TPA: isoprenylcysteine carboxylmethyltransferase family protein [Candidatus Limnocylindrales bacterium]|nr:isoprenylcysteine carboxylmethyltransferase family protein [Candidatus Limnocylindrales bacterium]
MSTMPTRSEFLFGRALPLGAYGLLIYIQGTLAIDGLQHALAGQTDRATTMYLVNRILTLLFFSFLFAIYIVRSRAVGKDHSVGAVATAMFGTLVLYSLWLLPAPRTDNLYLLATSDILLSCGMLLAVYSVSYLRHRFSVVPEARGLVTTGPYALVRHPIYLGEIVAALGLILPSYASFQLVIFVLFVAAQLRRTAYEESVLRKSFPEYAAYAARTRRLIPFVL